MSLDAILSAWGLPAILAGSAVEGDGTAFLAGVLAHRGLFPFEAAALTVALGAFIGDETLFFLGRHSARFGFVRKLLSKGPVAKVQDLVRRHPTLLILGFRFLYGARTVGALSLGAAGVSVPRFVSLNLLAVLVWAHVFTGLGFGLGLTLHRVLGEVPLHWLLVMAAAVALVVFGLAWRLHHRRRRRRLLLDPR